MFCGKFSIWWDRVLWFRCRFLYWQLDTISSIFERFSFLFNLSEKQKTDTDVQQLRELHGNVAHSDYQITIDLGLYKAYSPVVASQIFFYTSIQADCPKVKNHQKKTPHHSKSHLYLIYHIWGLLLLLLMHEAFPLLLRTLIFMGSSLLWHGLAIAMK